MNRAVRDVLTVDHNTATVTLSEPQWLKRLLDAVEGTYRKPVLPADLAPTPAMRAALTGLRSHLQSAIETGPQDLMMAQVTDLLLAFPISQVNEQTASSRARAFANALEDLPAWAVANGCRAWLRGEHSEGKENYAFPPSPPQLRRLSLIHFQPVKAMLGRVHRFLIAEVEHIWTDEERRNNLQKLQELSKQIQKMPTQPAVGRDSPNADIAADAVARVTADIDRRCQEQQTEPDGTTENP